MTSKRSYTQKLIIIFLSVVICVVSLVAMTFGLFTSEDTSFIRVSSSKVKIDLLMANSSGEYESIRDTNGELFGNEYWEPNQTRFVFLKVKSNSNIRVKYSMRIDALNEDMLGAFEYVSFRGSSLDPSITQYSQIKEMYDPVLLENGINFISDSDYVYLEPGEEHDYVLVLHMLKESTNEFQGKSFALDLNVIAVQGNYTPAVDTEGASESTTESESVTMIVETENFD